MSDASRPLRGGDGNRWRRGLAARLTFVIALMLAGLAALLTGVAAIEARHAAAAAIESGVVAETEQIASALSDGDLAPEGLADGPAAASVDYLYLTTNAGERIAGAAPASQPLFSAGAIAATDDAVATLADGGSFHAAKRVTLPDGRQAVLRAGRSLAVASAPVRGIVAGGLLATLAFLALALPAAALLIDRAAAPLRALTRAVTRSGSADDEVRRAGDRSDEIGALARAHLAIARDLAENADALHRLTFDDPLTRLPNRSSLTSRLARTLQVGERVALLKIEVDGMLRVAAGLGQRHGDEATLGVAERLGAAAAEWAAARSDGADGRVLLARTTDSGFAILALGADAAAAEDLAGRALRAFETPLEVAGHRLSMSLAIGVALGPDDGEEAETLLRSASAAMSAARASGPQAMRAAGADLAKLAYGRLRLEQDLRRALDRGELEVHFQPQIALRPGVVSGAEALARWRHPTRGYVPPAEFIAIAEECGLVEPLGRFVLAEASRTSARWTALGMSVRIAVNVSTIQFRNPRFAKTALEIVRAAGAEPGRIELEITESAAMGDPKHALGELTPLKEAGVRIAIDDFGTGYSNLATLTQLPFDVLKIDRGFVRDALEQTGARVVVGTVIAMAENLGFETVAEGVETAEQLDFVTSHGCTYAQGYLFGRPMAAPAFEAWYAKRLASELKALAERVSAEAGVSPASARMSEARRAG